MYTRKIAIAAVFLAVSCVNASVGSAGSETVGKYVSVTGRVDVLHEGAPSTARVKQDEPVMSGDIIRTKSGSKAEIAFADKTVMRMAPSSRVGIEAYTVNADGMRDDARLMLYRGKIRTIVSSAGGKENFHIDTPNAEGTVKGTDVFTFYQADTTGVLVAEGAMSIHNQGIPDDVAELRKGDYVSVPADGIPGEPRDYMEAELFLHEKDTEPAFISRPAMKGKGILTMGCKITMVSGKVFVYKKGGEKARPARMDEVLTEGDRVRTGDDGRTRITLENGNSLSLQPESDISIKSIKADPKTGEYENLFESTSGKIKAVVEKLGSKSTFKVKTPTAVCAVRGTVMYLDVTPDNTTAFYEGGGGDITSLVTGDTEEVGAGQNSSADASGNISVPTDTGTDDRMGLDDSWESSGSVDGYSDPADDTSQDPLPSSQTGSDQTVN